MRDFKFRAKPFGKEEWVYGSLIDSGNHEQVAIFPGYDGASSMGVRELVINNLVAVDCETVCAFTEQYDEFKRPIYEGDIVDIHGEDGYWVVEWDVNTSAYVLANELDCVQVTFDNYYGYEMEIIGNVFDDKYLLEV